MRRPDEDYIKLAIGLARKGKGKTSPNPCVGAVVVKDGRIVGKGYHRKAGGPHAEVIALRQAGSRARGATLYVSLEPCSHYGRTPPCTDAVIASGVKRVVAAMKDPNPVNNGKGMSILKKAAIKTRLGVCEDEARRLNEIFIKYITTGMPFVAVKAAETLDGKIAARTGDSKWITSPAARRFVHGLRSEYDAVMVGANTAVKDDPMLTSRPGKNARQPARIILAGNKKIPRGSKIFKVKGGDVIIAKSAKGKVALRPFFRRLAKEGITSILIEGGGETIASAIEAGLVDKIYMLIAPKIIGGRSAKSPVEGKGISRVTDAVTVNDMKTSSIGGDLLIEGYIKH